MTKPILGKWTQTASQPYPGLFFNFKEDGTFEAVYEAMAITSSGTWSTEGDEIDIDQTSHTFGLVGKFIGRFEIDGDLLKMNLVTAGEKERPENLTGAVIYQKLEE
ncbi:MAG TPA: hypothetical protein VLR89_09870 [Anaerolineaceae bacterium]|nr:hypothetical protein [Anaerolineaceae bacterium]